jgi:hypothetical protein
MLKFCFVVLVLVKINFAQAPILVINENFDHYPSSNQLYISIMAATDFDGLNSRAAGEVRGLDIPNTWPQRTMVGNGTVRAHFPANIAGGTNSGFLFDKNFADTEEATMEYRLKFSEGFVWAAGGKLPGLGGGTLTGNGSTPVGCTKDVNKITNGFSTRLMWRTRGQLVVYTYFPDRIENSNNCGVDYKFADVQANKWYTVRQYIKMNTPGVKNGILEMYLDGELALRKTDVFFRNSGKSGIKANQAIFHTYRGGGAEDVRFHSPQTDYVFFDDIKVWRGKYTGEPAPLPDQPPIISIISPETNSTYNLGQTISLEANASDPEGAIARVNFKVNDMYYSQDQTAPYKADFTPTEVGSYKLAARAFDEAGLSTEVFIDINVVQNDVPVPFYQHSLSHDQVIYRVYDVQGRPQDWRNKNPGQEASGFLLSRAKTPFPLLK